MQIYPIGKFLFTLYFKLMNRLTIEGIEHFPTDKGVLICSNHMSNMDPPLIGVSVPRRVHFMAKAEMFSIPVFNKLITHLGSFPVKRGSIDKQALRRAISLLNEGKVVVLFPEGTRNKSGELKPGLSGAGFLALRTDAVVIPCALVGSYRPFKKITAVFGKPLDFSTKKTEKFSSKEATAIIMDQIRQLMEQRKI